MTLPQQIEPVIERSMYASRWFLASIYEGMRLVLLALFVKFFEELYHFLPHIFATSETNFILTLLTLIDLTLFGSLIVLIMVSGYENLDKLTKH